MKPLVLLLSIVLSSISMPSFANIESIAQAINESGRLRMLSQRMAKTRLLYGMGIQPKKALKQYKSSKTKFEQNIIDLADFISTPGQLIALNKVKKNWATYKVTLESDPSPKQAEKLLLLSDKTLAACEKLVQELEKVANRNSAHWVNISGRQRMLSQRIAKLYTAISWTGSHGDNSKRLNIAVQEFEDALNQLINAPENTSDVKKKLRSVQTQWNFSKAGFRFLKKGQSTPLVIAMTTEKILRQMNDITALYERIDITTL